MYDSLKDAYEHKRNIEEVYEVFKEKQKPAFELSKEQMCTFLHEIENGVGTVFTFIPFVVTLMDEPNLLDHLPERFDTKDMKIFLDFSLMVAENTISSYAEDDLYEKVFNPVKMFVTINGNLSDAIMKHDESKLSEPERSCYDKFIPMLKLYKFGTPEYYSVRQQMKEHPGGKHIFTNRHHPEFFGDKLIYGMNLVDFLEMFMDHIASSFRSDTSLRDGEKSNAERYKYPKYVLNMIINSYDEMYPESNQ